MIKAILAMKKAFIKPKSWAQFQHYKNRRPPWIKLHRTILDDYEYQGLNLASKALAPSLWLIASEHDEGLIEVDVPKLAWRLRVSEKDLNSALKELINKGFFENASMSQAECFHYAIPERETETEETETKAEGEKEIASLSSAKRPHIPVQEIIQAYNLICVPVGRPAATVINKKRKVSIERIWRSSPHVQDVDWWREYFAAAMQIPYMANGFSKSDGSTWPGADLDYLLQEKTVTKVVERA